RSGGEADPGEVERRAERMAVIPERRAPVVVTSLVTWILATALIALLLPAARPDALAWLALAFAYMPLMLLVGAAIEPTAIAEGLIVGLGAALLALATHRLVAGWWSLTIACAVTVVAYAIDVIAGSGLTKLSLLGPNPIFGVRFYGIGNELEALFAVMVPVAIGAALTARRATGRSAPAAVLIARGGAAPGLAPGPGGAERTWAPRSCCRWAPRSPPRWPRGRRGRAGGGSQPG